MLLYFRTGNLVGHFLMYLLLERVFVANALTILRISEIAFSNSTVNIFR